MVPDLVGLTFEQAKSQLESIGINIAGIIPYSPNLQILDTAGAFVCRQNPEPLDDENRPIFIRPGQLMDLYIAPVMITPPKVQEDSIQQKTEIQ